MVCWHRFVELLLLCGIAAVSPALAAPSVGQPAPALAAQTLDGRSFDLDRLRGKVVIVNFWATWCPPCREEMPVLEEFYRSYRAKGVELIGVSDDSRHDIDEVRKVMRAFSYPALMLIDARANGFGMPHLLPLTYVIDTAGVVRALLRPDREKITPESLAEVVSPLLPSDANTGPRH